MLAAPMAVEIGPGAVAGLGDLLADRRISSGGHVAVAVGPGYGDEIAAVVDPAIENCDVLRIEEGGTLESALALAERLRTRFYDAVVGIGGGGTLDVAKHAASLVGLPMVAVATSLSHDGIASPVSSLSHKGRKASYGVQMPVAVLVDLDYVRTSPARMRRSGVGDVLSNLTAVEDWRLAERERGEPVDGLSAALAHTGAEAVLQADGGVDDDEFLIVLAEALVLSGLAMATAGSSRPCSGADHEIVHAIDHLFPDTGMHGELAGVGARFAAFLHGHERLAAELDTCLGRHGLPRSHRDLGLSDDQFIQAVAYAPSTRPGRFTILEHLDLDEEAIRNRVHAYADALAG
ncbi:MAG TPA: iron-containing alcohol dehydrogenase family protein [Thermoleophilaceae bacterium]|nr:iron-containing alcohol dehydrogenase family protein [Thermoleophilaceae bacterium]